MMETNRMKVALCLHGHFRSFDRCYPHLLKHIIEPYSPDVFAMAWGDSMGTFQEPADTVNPTNHPGYNLDSPAVGMDYIRRVIECINPVDMHLDHYYLRDAEFSSILDRYIAWNHQWQHHRPKGTISLNWSRYAVHSLRRSHERLTGKRYDLVISTRWDLMHSMPIDLTTLHPNILTLPMMFGHDIPGDIWAAGSPEIMDSWSEQINGMEELAGAGTLNLGPHEWMKAWLAHKGIRWSNHEGLGVYLLR